MKSFEKEANLLSALATNPQKYQSIKIYFLYTDISEINRVIIATSKTTNNIANSIRNIANTSAITAPSNLKPSEAPTGNHHLPSVTPQESISTPTDHQNFFYTRTQPFSYTENISNIPMPHQ